MRWHLYRLEDDIGVRRTGQRVGGLGRERAVHAWRRGARLAPGRPSRRAGFTVQQRLNAARGRRATAAGLRVNRCRCPVVQRWATLLLLLEEHSRKVHGDRWLSVVVGQDDCSDRDVTILHSHEQTIFDNTRAGFKIFQRVLFPLHHTALLSLRHLNYSSESKLSFVSQRLIKSQYALPTGQYGHIIADIYKIYPK